MKRIALAVLAFLALCAPLRAQQNLATTNSSITIAAGNTFQQAVAALGVAPATRRSITIQNNNTSTDNCWVFIGATGSATKGTSILLAPGGSYQRYWPYVPSDNIAATCANTSDTLYVDIQ
jgi:hypothetical protein